MTNFEWPERVTLELRAYAYKNAVFGNRRTCPVAKTAMEFFPSEETCCYAVEGGDHIRFIDALGDEIVRYDHDKFGESDFDKDHSRASYHRFGGTIIRKIVLTRKH